jgi:hypothetical protein
MSVPSVGEVQIMNRSEFHALILIVTLLLAGCDRKSGSNENANANDTQTTASNTAPPPPAEPQPAPEVAPPPQEPIPTVKPKVPRRAEKMTEVPAQVAVPPPPPPKPIVIPAGTVLNVRLEQPISSKSSKTGDSFQASVSTPVVVDGKTLVPTGAQASGTVTEAKDAGRFKGAAAVTLALDSVVVGGKPFRVETTPITKTSKGKGSRTAKMVGGGTAGGALIGGLAGGGKGAAIGALVGAGAGTAGAATGNADINLPVESVIAFQTTAPIVLPAATPTHVNHPLEDPATREPPKQ